MSQKEWTVADRDSEEVLPKSIELLRKVLIQVLSRATEGHFLLRENCLLYTSPSPRD